MAVSMSIFIREIKYYQLFSNPPLNIPETYTETRPPSHILRYIALSLSVAFLVKLLHHRSTS
jgi:hypothetical protein